MHCILLGAIYDATAAEVWSGFSYGISTTTNSGIKIHVTMDVNNRTVPINGNINVATTSKYSTPRGLCTRVWFICVLLWSCTDMFYSNYPWLRHRQWGNDVVVPVSIRENWWSLCVHMPLCMRARMCVCGSGRLPGKTFFYLILVFITVTS